jgi:hypothetical protein
MHGGMRLSLAAAKMRKSHPKQNKHFPKADAH